jgi:hypothetical protein
MERRRRVPGEGILQRFPKKKFLKKCLTTFLRSGIGLKNSNSIVSLFHNLSQKGGEEFRGYVVVNSVSGLKLHETWFTHHKIKETTNEEEKR